MKRSATAIWQGSLKQGNDALTAQSYVLSAEPRWFHCELDSPAAVGGQELIAAAHTRCLARALSDGLIEADDTHEEVRVTADIILDNTVVQGWSITSSHLVLLGKVARTRAGAFSGQRSPTFRIRTP